MFNIFKKNKEYKRKYTLYFKKELLLGSTISHIRYVTDSCILKNLTQLQKEYDFDVVSVSLKDTYDVSKITIMCTKEDTSKIFMSFCARLEEYICDVSFK